MITEKTKMNTVSVIIPIYNEEKYVEKLTKSLIDQTYERSKFEVIFVDGNSEDKTKENIEKALKESKINYKIICNPKKITPMSVNIGIKQAENDIIIRLDAHSEYPNNYIEKCVYYINNIDADNVGCTVTANGKNKIQKAIANVVSSKFGVGNSSFRTDSKNGYVDTVPFGTFRKELFKKIGYFNEELLRSEDNEFNHRIIKNGGNVYLFNDIKVIYYPRETILKFLKMGFENGKWGIYTSYIIPGTMKFRHFIPMLFVIGIVGGILFLILQYKILSICFIVVVIMYLLLDVGFTIKNILKDGITQLSCFIIYPLFHISYGIGSIAGIKKIIMRSSKNGKNK